MAAANEGVIDNECVLSEELSVLESIYITELTVERDKDGWPRTISVLLHPATGMDETKKYVCMTLIFTIPHTYPEDAPQINVRNPRGLGEEELQSLIEDMKKLAEKRKGGAMLFELIEMAKDCLTEGNLPHCECAICLEHFEEGDAFIKTECYHYFHRACLARYAAAFVSSIQEEEEPSIPHAAEKEEEKVLGCPMCRLPLTCDLAELLAEPVPLEEKVEFIPSPDLRQQQAAMAKRFEEQKSRDGIIDVEKERNKFLVSQDTVVSLENIRKQPESSPRVTFGTSSQPAPRMKNGQPPGAHAACDKLDRPGAGHGSHLMQNLDLAVRTYSAPHPQRETVSATTDRKYTPRSGHNRGNGRGHTTKERNYRKDAHGRHEKDWREGNHQKTRDKGQSDAFQPDSDKPNRDVTGDLDKEKKHPDNVGHHKGSSGENQAGGHEHPSTYAEVKDGDTQDHKSDDYGKQENSASKLLVSEKDSDFHAKHHKEKDETHSTGKTNSTLRHNSGKIYSTAHPQHESYKSAGPSTPKAHASEHAKNDTGRPYSTAAMEQSTDKRHQDMRYKEKVKDGKHRPEGQGKDGNYGSERQGKDGYHGSERKGKGRNYNPERQGKDGYRGSERKGKGRNYSPERQGKDGHYGPERQGKAGNHGTERQGKAGNRGTEAKATGHGAGKGVCKSSDADNSSVHNTHGNEKPDPLKKYSEDLKSRGDGEKPQLQRECSKEEDTQKNESVKKQHPHKKSAQGDVQQTKHTDHRNDHSKSGMQDVPREMRHTEARKDVGSEGQRNVQRSERIGQGQTPDHGHTEHGDGCEGGTHNWAHDWSQHVREDRCTHRQRRGHARSVHSGHNDGGLDQKQEDWDAEIEEAKKVNETPNTQRSRHHKSKYYSSRWHANAHEEGKDAGKEGFGIDDLGELHNHPPPRTSNYLGNERRGSLNGHRKEHGSGHAAASASKHAKKSEAQGKEHHTDQIHHAQNKRAGETGHVPSKHGARRKSFSKDQDEKAGCKQGEDWEAEVRNALETVQKAHKNQPASHKDSSLGGSGESPRHRQEEDWEPEINAARKALKETSLKPGHQGQGHHDKDGGSGETPAKHVSVPGYKSAGKPGTPHHRAWHRDNAGGPPGSKMGMPPGFEKMSAHDAGLKMGPPPGFSRKMDTNIVPPPLPALEFT